MNRWLVLGAVFVIGVLAVAVSDWALHASPPKSGVNPAPETYPSAGLDYAREQKGLTLPASNSKVKVDAWLSSRTQSAVVLIRLEIAKGWHVNANPPSLGFLIPTVAKIIVPGRGAAISVESYPQGQTSHIRLDNKEIRVYANGTTLKARISPTILRMARTAGSLVVNVQLQACSNRGICLPPAEVRSIVPIPSSGGSKGPSLKPSGN